MVSSVAIWFALGSTASASVHRLEHSEDLEWNRFLKCLASATEAGTSTSPSLRRAGKLVSPSSMHRWSKLFIPTLREAPADAEVASHKFLLRAGYIRQLGAGLYNYLFLGQRSLNKMTAIVREEMDKIGQEFYLPGILPREPWEESGRWTGMGDNMFRL